MNITPTDDTATVLALLDKAAAWLVTRGRTGQWGTQRQSTNPRRIAMAHQWAESGGLYLAWLDGVAVGALAVGSAPEWIPPAPEPELYVNLLVTDRDHAGKGIGGALLDHARELAEAAGKPLLRLDCYAGDDRALVRYYESQGFTAAQPFTFEKPDGTWHGQVLVKRLRPAA
jgi:GNAT superfamily N-acetyltransferase